MKNQGGEKINIIVDPDAGFCFGVIRAIDVLDNMLDISNDIYCLGDVVHNEEEIKRLQNKGLKIIDHESVKTLKNKKVVIRAHGEPQSTYDIAKNNNIDVTDATCPIVLQLQAKIRKQYKTIKEHNGQIVIYGKIKHPEVIGLNGQTEDNAIIIENISGIDKIDFNKPIRLFSQTTSNTDRYKEIIEEIKRRKAESDDKSGSGLEVFETICTKVSNRAKHIKDFAKNNCVVIFVSDKKSSNGKYLYQICKSVNKNCHFISNASEIRKEWFRNVEKIGISGATSTPSWLMEKVADEIKKVANNTD